MPAILLMSKATQSNGSSKFGGFVGYIGREDAFKLKELTDNEVKNIILNDGEKNNYAFRNYIYYEKNPLKSNGLFDRYNDYLNAFQQKNLVRKINQAEKNGSPLFQDVISFDNKFLEENNIYNHNSGYLNEAKMKQSIRKGMEYMLKKEGFKYNKNTVWAAAIHRNTDNIHVHIATTEINTTRPKIFIAGTDKEPAHYEYKIKRKFNSLKMMKHIVLQNVMDGKTLEKHNELLNKIDEKSREMKEKTIKNFGQDKVSIRGIVSALPNSRKLWRYNSNATSMKTAQERVNGYVDKQLKGDLEPHYKVFTRLVNNQNDMYEDLYGKTDRDQNIKFDRLKEQLANGIYKEIKKEFNDIEKNENSIFTKNFDPDTLDKIKRRNAFKLDKERKKINENKINELSEKLKDLSSKNMLNSKEYILTKERLEHFKQMNGSLKNANPDVRAAMYKDKRDFNFSKLKLKPDVQLMRNGIINYNALQSLSAKQIEYANGYAMYSNLYNKQTTLNHLFKNNNDIQKSLNKNIGKMKNPKIKAHKKAIVFHKISRDKDIRNLNYKKIAHAFDDAEKVNMINHYKYRSVSYPSYRQIFKEQSEKLSLDRIKDNEKFAKSIKKLQKEIGKSETNLNRSTKKKLLRSPKRMRNLSHNIKEASLNNLLRFNHLERQEHKIKVKEYEKEMEIKRAAYYENQGRDL